MLELALKELVASDAATVEALTARLKQAETIAEFQRVQCVPMRAALDCSASEIAQVLGWAVATVHITHSRWAKEGEAIFELKGKGGRRSHNLTEERPRHPEADVTARGAFKKSSAGRSVAKSVAKPLANAASE